MAGRTPPGHSGGAEHPQSPHSGGKTPQVCTQWADTPRSHSGGADPQVTWRWAGKTSRSHSGGADFGCTAGGRALRSHSEGKTPGHTVGQTPRSDGGRPRSHSQGADTPGPHQWETGPSGLQRGQTPGHGGGPRSGGGPDTPRSHSGGAEPSGPTRQTPGPHSGGRPHRSWGWIVTPRSHSGGQTPRSHSGGQTPPGHTNGGRPPGHTGRGQNLQGHPQQGPDHRSHNVGADPGHTMRADPKVMGGGKTSQVTRQGRPLQVTQVTDQTVDSLSGIR